MKRFASACAALSVCAPALAQQGVTVYGVVDLGVVRDSDSGSLGEPTRLRATATMPAWTRATTCWALACPVAHPHSPPHVRKQDRSHANADAWQLALGDYYALSRRSNIYLIASSLHNGTAVRYQARLPGGACRLLACGMRHQF